jgi:hypothetical protein
VASRADRPAVVRATDPRASPLLLDLAAGREPAPTSVDQHLVQVASDHRMTGLLWSWARTRPLDPEVKEWLAKRDLRSQAHLQRVWRVLGSTVERLGAIGIDVATVKGVTAEARWYERRGERPCSDVDLLLSPHQPGRVADAVRLLQPDHPWASFVARMAESDHLEAVTLNVDGLEVDLHLDLLKLGVPTRQTSAFWARTEPFGLPGGGEVRVLDDTTALLHLLVHLNKDRFQRLLGYADVARIAGSGAVDWDRFEGQVRAEGLEVPVLSTLAVVVGELGLPPLPVSPPPAGTRAAVWSILWRPEVRLRGSEGRLRFRQRQNWLPLLARGRGREAVGAWLRILLPPAPAVDARYPHVDGPYVWKLMRGRFEATTQNLERVRETRAWRNEPHAGSRWSLGILAGRGGSRPVPSSARGRHSSYPRHDRGPAPFDTGPLHPD